MAFMVMLMLSLMWVGLAVASPLLGYYATFVGKKITGLYFSAFVGAVAFVALLEFHFPMYIPVIIQDKKLKV